MKLRSARVEPTEDGKFTVECDYSSDSKTEMMGPSMNNKRYIADSLSDIPNKIQEGMDACKGKPDKPSKGAKNRSVKGFLNGPVESTAG
jgi:hypothetical protein